MTSSRDDAELHIAQVSEPEHINNTLVGSLFNQTFKTCQLMTWTRNSIQTCFA